MTTPADLIAEHNKIKAFVEAETKRFDEFLKPHKQRLVEIDNRLLEMLNEQKCESFKTDFGTAYKSVITTPKLTDKEKFLDWVLDNWDKWGAMLQIGAPQKATLDDYVDENSGHLPPYVETSQFIRLNIRKA